MAVPSALLLALALAAAVRADGGERLLDIPARFMWGWGPGTSGYCGSASIQTAALYYGNWLTQDAVRGSTGGHDAAHEIVLGESSCCSAVAAARHFRLRVLEWEDSRMPRPQADAFVAWLKDAVDAGQPAVFGVFMTVEVGSHFDHIVPLVGYSDDAVLFNDLYFNHTLRAPLRRFVKARHECRDVPEHEGVESYCLPHDVNYGFRVLGNDDPRGELLPVRLDMASNSEPDYSVEDGRHAAPARLTGTVVVSGLSPGARYALLWYTEVDSLPSGGGFLEELLAGGGAPEEYFVGPPGGTYRRQVSFASDSAQFFRCVAAPGEGTAAGTYVRIFA